MTPQTTASGRVVPQEDLDALADLLAEVDERLAAEDAAQTSTA
jgi:hypothetical protein